MIALSLFLGVMVAVAAAGVQITSVLQRAELKQAVQRTMGRNLDTLQTTGFDQLVGELYTAPNACASRGVGRQTSCEAARGRAFTVRYATELGVDVAAGAGTSASYVAVTARSTLPDGSTVTATRRIPAPTLGFTGDTAVLRVRAADAPGAEPLPISLLDASGTVVVGGVPFTNDLAVLRVPGDACTGDAGPCKLALDGDAEYYQTAGYALSPKDVLGPNGRLELAPGSFTDVSATIGPLGAATVHLLAQATDGTEVAPPAAVQGSVCLWGSFPDGARRRSVPFCNDTDPATITLASFTDPGSGTTYPLPAGSQLSLAVDPPDGACAGQDQYAGTPIQGAHGPEWSDAEVCTSWTWGTPSLWGRHGAAEPQTLPQTITTATGGTASYDLVWAATRTASKDWAQVASGATQSCGVTTAHTLWCWGPDAPGAGAANTPVQLGTDQDWARVSVGAAHACATKRGGALWCWGANDRGQLGDGTTTARSTPVQVGTQRYQSVAAGTASTCAIRLDATLWCWGDDATGQLGVPTDAIGVAAAPIETGTDALGELTVGPDGNLWATDGTGPAIVKYSPAGVRLASYGGLSAAATAITVGPDGALWFTEPAGNRIGRITTAGVITEFATGTGLTNPVDLTVGPDGALWFAPQNASAKLGRITTSGTVSSCAIAAGDQPNGITTGRSGALWYTSASSNRVARVRTTSCGSGSATVAGYAINGTGRALVLGPDANVWFATSTGQLGRVTDAGVVSQWSAGTGTVTDLAAGADGNLWYATASNRIAKITPTGTTTELRLAAAANASLAGIVVDGAGAVWATDPTHTRVLRVELYRSTPIQVGSASSWSAISVGARHACGLQGSVARCWGANDTGQAGVALPAVAAPVPLRPAVGSPTTVAGAYTGISAGAAHTCAVATDDTARCWGTSTDGRLGAASATLGLTRRIGLGGSGARGVAVDEAGAVWSALTTSDTVLRYQPATGVTTRYALPAGAAPDGVAVSGGYVYVAEPGIAQLARIAVSTGTITQLEPPSAPVELEVAGDGAVWYSTANTAGKLGRYDGSFTEYSVASGSCTATRDVAIGPDGLTYALTAGTGCAKLARLPANGGVVQFVELPGGFAPVALDGGSGGLWVTSAEGESSRLAKVATNGSVTTYGSNTGTPANGIAANNIHDVLVAHDGRIWYAADATVGVFDPDTATATEYPVPAGGPQHSLAQDADDTVWVTDGPNGWLAGWAPGTATPQSLPGGAVWATVSAGRTHSCGVRASGSLWCWGTNTSGQLGTGDTNPRPAPSQVGDANGWSAAAAAVGADATCATTTQSAGWCWGSRSLTGGAASVGYDTTPQALSTDQDAAGPATPATGNELVDPWTKPRDHTQAWDAATGSWGRCADDNDATPCSSMMGRSAPERFGTAPEGCATDPFCLSSANAAPKLTDPAVAFGRTEVGVRPVGPMTAGSMNTVHLTVTDPERELVELRVTSDATRGELYRTPAGAALSLNTWYPVTSGVPVALGYVPATGFSGLDAFTVELRERAGQPGYDTFGHTPTTTQVFVYSNVTPLTLTPETPVVRATQGQVGLELPIAVVSTDGSAAAGTAITGRSPQATLALQRATVTVGGDGVATFALNVGATPVGSYRLGFQAANGRATSIDVVVDPEVATVTLATTRAGVSAASLAQGGTPLGVTATVRDRAGAVMGAQLVRLSVVDATGTELASVRPATANCVSTAGTGTCATTLSAERSAPAGSYRLVARAAGIETSAPLTVTATPATLAASAGKAAEDTYAAMVEADDPAVWLRLDEATGTVAAATAGPAGSYAGSVELAADPLAGSGTATAAILRGGKVCTDTSLQLGTSLTLEAWVRPEAGGGTRLVWGSSDAGAPRLSLVGMSPRFELVGAGSVTGAALPAGQSAHLLGVRAANRMELWVNGRLAASGTPAAATDPSVTLCAGDDATLAATAGTFDELAAYASALEPATITRHAAIGAATGAASGAGSVSVRQGGSVDVIVTALDGTGAPAADVSVTSQLSGAGLSLAGAGTTDAKGQTTLTLSALSSADPGTVRRLVLSAGPVHLTVLVTVEARPGGLAPTDLTLRQGGTATATVTVTDGASPANPVPGAVVRFATDADGGLRIPARATTDASGVARATLAADPSLATGSYEVRATVGGITERFTITVLAGVGRVFLDPGSAVRSGSGSTVRVVVRNADDGEVTGASVALSCLACGLSFDPGTATDGEGVAAITVTDSGGANPPGRYPVTATVDGDTYPVTVVVAARAGAITVQGATPVTVKRGGYAVVYVRVADDTAAANPVPAALVESTNQLSSNLLAFPALTGPDGRAAVVVVARAGASEPSYTLTLRTRGATGGWVTQSVPVSVSAP